MQVVTTHHAVKHLSAAAARRIALAAQGFANTRPTEPVTIRDILQLDSVNVFSRSHYLPVFSRLGPYDRGMLDYLAAHTAGPVRRELIEYWAHEASLVSVNLQPWLRWRMERVEDVNWKRMADDFGRFPQTIDEALALVAR